MFMFFFFKQKTAYEMRISDWSSDVCSSDLSFGKLRPRIGNATCGLQITDRRRRHFQFEALGNQSRFNVIAVAAASRQSRAAAVDILDNEARAVACVTLEVRKLLSEGRDIGAPATTAELCAQLACIDLFGSKTQRPGGGIRSRREDCRHRIYAGIA